MSDRRKQKPDMSDSGPQRRLKLEWVTAGSLAGNPDNWRRHPPGQLSALKNLIGDPTIGWCGCLLYNSRSQRLVDGHARRDCVPPETIVPVLVGDWSPEAERKILLTLDPIASMAIADVGQLEALLKQVELGDEWFS